MRGAPSGGALTVELSKLYLARDPDEFSALMRYGMALQAVARLGEARAASERALAAGGAGGRWYTGNSGCSGGPFGLPGGRGLVRARH